MATLKKRGLMAAALILISSMLACGGHTNTANPGGPFSTASLRVVVLNPTAGAVNVSVDGATVNNSLSYLGDTGYVPIRAGSAGELVIATSNPVAVGPINMTPNLASNAKGTFLLDGWAHFESSFTLLTDDGAAAPNSAAKLRIVDASLGVLHDIYLMPAGAAPSGTPLAVLSAFNSATSYQNLAPGAYDILFTKSGTKQVLFDSGAINLAAGQNRSVIILSDCQPNACNFNVMRSMVLADLN